MPGFLSSIPGLSAIPNPLNLFNLGDNSEPNTRPPLSPTGKSANPSSLPPTPETPGPGHSASSRIQSILASVDLMPSPNTPLVREEPPSSSSSAESSARASPSRKSGAVMIADEPDTLTRRTSGRNRGLSSASAAPSADSGPEKRRNRRVETFVLVKPPPTSAKNPLNLQVQLVVPLKKPKREDRIRQYADAVASGEISSAPSTPPRASLDIMADHNPALSQPMSQSTSAAGSDGSDPLQHREDSATVSGGGGRKRSGSIKSTASGSSGGTSGSSSTAGFAGGKRIIPLYNLAVHNVVQPTIVTDAGTDFKVAKFSKRALDITGVGILEPAEVWFPPAGHIVGGSPRPSIDTQSGSKARPTSMISSMSLLTPATSRLDDPNTERTLSVPMLTGEAVAVDNARRKFLGKIFKKRASADPLGEKRSNKTGAQMTGSRSQVFLVVEPQPGLSSASGSPSLGPAPPSVHFTGDTTLIGHPTFGLAPNLLTRASSDTLLDPNGAIIGLACDVPTGNNDEHVTLVRSSRPVGYAWTVRKWAKKNTEGWATHIIAAAAAGLDVVSSTLPGGGDEDVVFEWVKLRVNAASPSAEAALRRHPAAEGIAAARSSARENAIADASQLRAIDRRASTRRSNTLPVGESPTGSPTASRTSLVPAQRPRSRTVTTSLIAPDANAPSRGPPFRRVASGIPHPRRSETMNHINLDTDGASAHSKSSGGSGNNSDPAHPIPEIIDPADEGYVSDPEDSETPWACSVWVKRTGHRQLLATLTPAPHHPRIIGVLKIPEALKPISLANLIGETNPKATIGESMHNIAARLCAEVSLTEENLKDVVSVTAMWLVAREEFSGFGRKRKGEK